MAKDDKNKSLFQKLTRLFKSGPVVRRKLRTQDTTIAVPDRTKSSGALLFQKSTAPTYATITANAYNLSERLMRYQDFCEMEYCLHGATRIAQLDEEGFVTIEELARRCAENPDYKFLVYAYDHELKKIVPAWGKQARQTRVDHAWKVTFDSGLSIIGSANHRLMMRDGTYKKIEDLEAGDSMMPFYRKDLFNFKNDASRGYRWVYSTNPGVGHNGWIKEHTLIAQWAEDRSLTENEVVHHVNFKKSDNRPENLIVMTKSDHSRLHSKEINEKKWSDENHAWRNKFSTSHASWMMKNPPTKRSDVTFARILEASEQHDFDLDKISNVLDVDYNLIKSRLADFGFKNYQTFKEAYANRDSSEVVISAVDRSRTISELSLEEIKRIAQEDDTKSSLSIKLRCTVNVFDKFLWRKCGISWLDLRNQLGFSAIPHARAGRPKGKNNKTVTYQDICTAFEPDMTCPLLAQKLGVTRNDIISRLSQNGFKKFSEFSNSFKNHKVVSVEYHGVIPLYDLTVDGYKNFATDTVISHNTPEIAAAMDIYADETIATDEKGRSLHIYSDNEKIKEILEDLFYNTLNVEFNLRSWARNLPVHKDTPIPLLDGTTLTIENLAKKMKEEPGWIPWVYSIQDGTHRAVPGKVTWCDLTRKDSEIVRVWLDDGTYVDCTADHEWVLRDGTRMKAEDLTSGTSLMPFYRDVSSKKMNHRLDGYERVYDPCTELYEYTHRIVAENAVPNPEKWHVVHHVNFDKRNNDPTNLMKMTWSDHSILHQNASETLKRPDVVSKRMAGIDRWLRSDKHRSSAVDQLRKLQDVGLMRQSWDEYNASPQFAEDNEKRSLTMRGVWSSRRAELRDKMKIKFDGKCVDMIVEALRHEGKYLSPIRLGKILTSNSAFMTHFSSLNAGTHRDLTRTLSSHAGFESLLNKAGISSYLNLVSDRLPEIAATPWFKRALKKSERMSGVVPAMRDRHPSASQYMNHKVDRVERLTDRSDVYCMEVLGPQGEHDRHNFMVLSRHSDGSVNLNSGICSQNCKYGDFFLYNDVSPTHGVINAFPIPVNEIEREENYDPNDPMAVRFRWVTLGNRTLENWEVSHFRLLGNDMFLPYGSSVIEPARRIWRQLILIEDAMLVYRVVRAPERRVFYIDVANIPPENVPMYVEEQRKNLRSSQVIDRTTGRVDLRYNPLSVDEDYFIPVRGGESGTKIDTLAGGQNAAAVEDVAYIQKKLFAALKIPRAYLGYDESLSSKATLAQEDIRFSRTINVIQKTLISELNKLAIIHLYANGFDSEDLQNFTLRLSNPSTVAQQQKLELWRAKFEIAGSAPEGQMSKEFIRKEIWGLNDEQCIKIDDQRLKEKIVDATIEAAKPEGEDAGGGGEEGGGDLFGGEEGEEGEKAGEAESGGEESGGEDLFAGDDVSDKDDVSLLVSSDDPADDEDFPAKFSLKDIEIPVKAQRQLDRALYNRSRVRHHGPAKTHMPDFGKMVRHDSKSNSDPYDREWMRSYLSNPLGESSESPTYRTHISSDVLSSLKNMTNSSKFQTVHTPPRQTSPSVLIESNDLDGADAKEHEQTYIINDDESGDDR